MIRPLLTTSFLMCFLASADGFAVYRATGRATAIQTTIPQAFLPPGVVEGAEFSLEYSVDETVPLDVGFIKTREFAGFVGPSVAFDGFGGTINVFPASEFQPNGTFLFDLFDVTTPPAVTGVAADVLSISELEILVEDDFFAANPGTSTDTFPVQVPSITPERSSWLFEASVESDGFVEDLAITGIVDSIVLVQAPEEDGAQDGNGGGASDGGDMPGMGGGDGPDDGGQVPDNGGDMPDVGGGTPDSDDEMPIIIGGMPDDDGEMGAGGMPGSGGGGQVDMPDVPAMGGGAVPEPASLAIWMLLLAAHVGYRRSKAFQRTLNA